MTNSSDKDPEKNPRPESKRDLHTPFATMDDAEVAMRAFCDAVKEARDKFSIPDVVFAVGMMVRVDDQLDDPLAARPFTASFRLGDKYHGEALGAEIMAHARRNREAAVEKILYGPAKMEPVGYDPRTRIVTMNHEESDE